MNEVFIIVLSIFFFVRLNQLYGQRKKKHHYYTNLCKPPEINDTDIVFSGKELNLTNEDLHNILIKRFHYYNELIPALKTRFINRLKVFMADRTFIIKDDSGFREMPVLVSAAAIQLSFGLKQYTLPFYQYIRIYPQEYFSEKEFFKVLAGNVQDNVISIAWNHVMNSYEDRSDGTNTPLHEISHALYIQHMVIDENYADSFQIQYQQALQEFRIAHQKESKKENDHYSDYAETSLQEFWAETVELFFEKPKLLADHYPKLFKAMTVLLNQNPEKAGNPLLNNNMSLKDRLKKFTVLTSKNKVQDPTIL
jgi:MtfA peptidase